MNLSPLLKLFNQIPTYNTLADALHWGELSVAMRRPLGVMTAAVAPIAHSAPNSISNRSIRKAEVSVGAMPTLEWASRRKTGTVRGHVVAPGFIDPLTHSRGAIFEIPTAENFVRQGVTTLVEGNDEPAVELWTVDLESGAGAEARRETEGRWIAREIEEWVASVALEFLESFDESLQVVGVLRIAS